MTSPDLGDLLPLLVTRPPGPASRTWLTRAARTSAPMGPPPEPPKKGVVLNVPSGSIVYATAKGSNVVDVDGNRYVDLAAGFGAMLVGHGHPSVLRVLELQSARLFQALGDVFPSDARIGLMDRLAALYPGEGARVILGQSGADAVTAALKTAVLATGRPGVVAFQGSYHGLSYAPLAATALRESYRAPFASQLNPHVEFVEYPFDAASAARSLEQARSLVKRGEVGAVLVEPVLGRGGAVVPPPGFLTELAAVARDGGALFIADEIWTGLGRAGSMLAAVAAGVAPDVICLGKGLGGGLPMSATIGSEAVMQSWRRADEVVHTSTFAGAPLACATALATLDVVSRERLPSRSLEVGGRFLSELQVALAGMRGVADVRGSGLMIGVDFGPRPKAASRVQRALLERGYIVSTGGGRREVMVLTPPLTIAEALLASFVENLRETLHDLGE